MIISTVFWIIVSFSDGGSNHGNMNQLDVRFKTQASCQLTLEEIKTFYKPEWGNNIMDCVRVDNS